MGKPSLHLICNAHLDPVWQWQWEEGCAEALSTFGNAVEILNHDRDLVFNHNEAILYEWVSRYEPALFKEIQKLVRNRRWFVSGGWYLQPDLNLPGTESLIRQITEGRRFFKRHFNADPNVAYNVDSFGHSGGLPQILRLAGYKMYIHMRPQEAEMHLPSDLYRWQGVDGSTILTYRIAVGLYHTERDNIEQRLAEGTELALTLHRDVPVFWGIGNHGGGATREDLERIRAFTAKERRVNIIHSTPDKLYDALKKGAREAPVFRGDMQHVFTGCYTSLSRIKRHAQKSLGEIVQTEAVCTAAWWLKGKKYPAPAMEEVWRDHLFNDFHDVLPGSCTEPAERDALALYGKASESSRRLRLSAAVAFNEGRKRKLYVPVTVLNVHPAINAAPVEVEFMLDLRPKWTGSWHVRLFSLDGSEIVCQEEQPESLLPFNGWRRRVAFFGQPLPVGVTHYEIRMAEGEKEKKEAPPALHHDIDPASGLIHSVDAGDGRECIAGDLLRPLMVEDDGDAWGTDRRSYRSVIGRFETTRPPTTVCSGPVRTITETVLGCGTSSIIVRTVAYASWPVLEFQLQIHWNERHKRLKLSVPTVFRNDTLFCEVPGGAIHRPADGDEHVHGRWCLLEGEVKGKSTALAVINSGLHGLDFRDGEIRLSVLRSAAYCHEQGFTLGDEPARKYMDQGVHHVRLLVTAGDARDVRSSVTGLADWLSAPPAVYSHLPIGGDPGGGSETTAEHRGWLSLHPQSVRMTALKPSWDGKALIVRLHETLGVRTTATLMLQNQRRSIGLRFDPFEIKTVRIEHGGKWRGTDLIEER